MLAGIRLIIINHDPSDSNLIPCLSAVLYYKVMAVRGWLGLCSHCTSTGHRTADRGQRNLVQNQK